MRHQSHWKYLTLFFIVLASLSCILTSLSPPLPRGQCMVASVPVTWLPAILATLSQRRDNDVLANKQTSNRRYSLILRHLPDWRIINPIKHQSIKINLDQGGRGKYQALKQMRALCPWSPGTHMSEKDFRFNKEN